MKINDMSSAVKTIIFASTVIIVCVLCVLGFKTVNEGKSTTALGTSQLNSIAAEYSNVDKSVYDATNVAGSELVSLIKDVIEDQEYISIVVRTLEGSRTDYNYVYDDVAHSLKGEGTKTIEESKAQGAYINRSALFAATVWRDTNNNIICIWFEQKK
jgi:predicted methyltransferase